MPAVVIDGISEGDLRVAVWMSNQGKTKKSICEFLKIKYNTARLTKILTEFQEKLVQQEEAKKANRRRIFSNEEKESIASRYLELGSMAKVADEFLISSAKVKSILLEKQIPIKSRKTVIVDHITQNLDEPFQLNEVVFSKIHQSKCTVIQKYDEAYVEYLKNGYFKSVDNPHVTSSEDEEAREGVHYSIYWILEDGSNAGLVSSVEKLIKCIELNLTQTGQEFYRIKIQNSEDDEYYAYCKRGDLYKV